MVRTILMMVGVVMLLAACGGESEKHTLLGEILVTDAAMISASGDTCTAPGHPASIQGGETVFVTLGNGDELTTDLDDGRVTDEGNCSFEFVIDVPESDMYAFTVNNVAELKREQTIQKSIPDNLGHTHQDEGDWWVTLSLLD